MASEQRLRLSQRQTLRQRLAPRNAWAQAHETIALQREFREMALPERITVNGQLFAVHKTPGGFSHIERWLSLPGAIRHPWATLEGLAGPGWRTFMMLKEQRALVVDAGGSSERLVIVIKQIQVAPPLQRIGMATGLLRATLREFYPDWLVHGEAPSVDAIAWHARLNAVMPTRMLHFPHRPSEDAELTVARVTPGAVLDSTELDTPMPPTPQMGVR